MGWQLLVQRNKRTRMVGERMMSIGACCMLAASMLTPPWMYLGFFAAVAGALLCLPPIHRLPGFWIGVAFSVWVATSVLAGVAQGNRWPGSSAHWYAWLTVFLSAWAFRDARIRRAGAMCLGLAVTASVIVAWAQYFFGFDLLKRLPQGTAVGFAPHYINFGFSLAIACVLASQPLALYGLVGRQGWLVRCLPFLGMVVCNSRGQVLGSFVGLCSTFAARSRLWLIGTIGVGVVGAVALLGAMWLRQPGRFQRMISFEDERLAVWRAACSIIRENLVFGTGGPGGYFSCYRDAFVRTNGEEPLVLLDPHNSWIGLTAYYGPAGLLLYLALWVVLLMACWRVRKAVPMAFPLATGVATTMFACGLFENLACHSLPGFTPFIAIGLALGLVIERQDQEGGAPQALPRT